MAAAAVAPQAILRTRHLGLRLGGATIVDDVSLAVRPGEFITIIGPNGAGKTTLFNLVSGIVRPTSGVIELEGRVITTAPPYERARLGLGRTFQSSSLFPALSVLENVRLAAQAAGGGSLRLWRRAAGDRVLLERARRALALARLAGREGATAGALAYGDKRKLELAILLASETRVVLLDEPTAGMSVEEVPELMAVIRAIHRDEGKTVLMVEHRMDVIVGLSDRMAVMHHGRLLALDTPAAVMANPEVQAAYLGQPL